MSILSLCSGYGGLELAIQATFGHQTIDAVCDNYKPARQVLTRHRPDANIHTDVNDPSLLDYKSDTVAFGSLARTYPALKSKLDSTGRAAASSTPA